MNNLYYTQTLAFLLRKNKKGTPNLLIEEAIMEFLVFEVTLIVDTDCGRWGPLRAL